MSSHKSPIALTIAGSDSGGGAGIQADLKTFSALGAYGCSVVTALTAQNTQGVQGIYDIEPGFVRQQLDSVFSDIDVLATKVGMLSRPEIIEVVANAIDDYQLNYLVVDPVMVATSGDLLLQREAIASLRDTLIPKASLITPNLPEAAVLLDCPRPENSDEMLAMIEPLMKLGSDAVLLKGGHLAADNTNGLAVDYYHDGKILHRLESPWVKTTNTHGTGCTLSSAVTALLARGHSITEAVHSSKEYIAGAIASADQLNIGKGHGPVHHFYRSW